LSQNKLTRLPDKTYMYRGFHITRGTATAFVSSVPSQFGDYESYLSDNTMRNMKTAIDVLFDRQVNDASLDAPPLHSKARLDWVYMKFYEFAKLHGLVGWKFRFDEGKTRAGQCKYHAKVITVSRYHALRSEALNVIDTLLHEIAHALVGRGIGHGPAWVSKAIEIGCNGERCHSLTFTKAPYIVSCNNGCYSQPRHRAMHNISRYHCRTCKGKLTLRRNK